MDPSDFANQQHGYFNGDYNAIQNYGIPTNQASQPTSSSKPPAQRKPGNAFTHLLPLLGGGAALLLAPETGGLSLAALPALGIGAGLAAGGSVVGKGVENFLEKQPLMKGTASEAEQGALGGAVGGVLSPFIGKAIGAVASKIPGLAGKEAARAATEGASRLGAKTDAVQQALRTAATSNKGDLLRSSVRNVEAVVSKEPAFAGSPVADASAEVNQWMDKNGLTGSAKDQLNKLAAVQKSVNSKLDAAFKADASRVAPTAVKSAITDAVKQLPEYSGSGTQAFDNELRDMYARIDKFAAQNPDGQLSLKDVNAIKQNFDSEVHFRSQSSTATNSVGDRAWSAGRTAARDLIDQSNPEVSGLITEQRNGMAASKSLLGSRVGPGRTTATIGLTGPRVRTQALANLAQKGTDAFGRGLQNASAKTAVSGGSNEILGHLTGDKIARVGVLGALEANQQAGERANAVADLQKLQGSGAADFSQPSDNINQLISQSQGAPSDNALGMDPSQIEQAMQEDALHNNGKNLTALNKLYSVAKSTSKAQQLPSGAVGKLSSYQGQLGSLNRIWQSFNSNASYSEVNGAIQQETPTIAKALGISATNKAQLAQLQSILPSASDDPLVAQQKLAKIKQVIDGNTEDYLSQAMSRNSQNDQLGSLLGGLSGGQ